MQANQFQPISNIVIMTDQSLKNEKIIPCFTFTNAPVTRIPSGFCPWSMTNSSEQEIRYTVHN